MIRVLIADDSATARNLLATILGEDPDIEIVGVARDGIEAETLALSLRPDVVTMDVEMPGRDGYEATRRIVSAAPLRVLIVSAIADPNDAGVMMRALDAGALTVLRKPEGPGSPSFEADARWLRRVVRSLADMHVLGKARPRPGASAPAASSLAGSRRAPSIVGVAASTGGPQAVRAFLLALTRGKHPPVVLVQHLAAGFVHGFAAWLGRECALPISVAAQGDILRPGTVHVAPDGAHLEVQPAGRVFLSSAPPVAGFRPSATPLFASLARSHGSEAAAVVLTGMGEDGLAGVEAIRAVGGLVLAQDEATSVVHGMPGKIVGLGLADAIGPVESLASTILELSEPRRRER